MNDVGFTREALPTAPKELAPFIRVGEVAVDTARKLLKSSVLTQEQYESILTRAQEQGEVVLDAKAALGTCLSKLDNGAGRPKIICTEQEQIKPTKQATYNELNITRKEAANMQAIAQHPEAVEAAKQEAKGNNDIVTTSLVLAKIKEADTAKKQAEREASIEAQRADIEANPMPVSGEYDCIVIDPPWNYGTTYDPDWRGTPPYPMMSQEELLKMPIAGSANSIMFLWTTQSFIRDAFALLEAWGYEYRQTLVWDKEKIGLGQLFRVQCEFCLVGIRGKPLLNNTHDLRDIIREARREHSRKPEAFYAMVEGLCVGTKLEYFARETRKGWSVMGNDTNRF